MLLIPPKITPAGLHLAVVAILDEFLQGLLSVFGAVYTQPEIGHLVVVVQVPLVELLAGVDV